MKAWRIQQEIRDRGRLDRLDVPQEQNSDSAQWFRMWALESVCYLLSE